MNEPQCVWRNRKSSLSSHSPRSLPSPSHYLSPSLIPLLPLSISCAPFLNVSPNPIFLPRRCRRFLFPLNCRAVTAPFFSCRLDASLVFLFPPSSSSFFFQSSNFHLHLDSCTYSDYSADAAHQWGITKFTKMSRLQRWTRNAPHAAECLGSASLSIRWHCWLINNQLKTQQLKSGPVRGGGV